MSRFNPPDVDHAMTPDAQRVASEASAKLDAWLAEVFAGLETEFARHQELLSQQLKRECQLFVDEEQRQSARLLKQAELLADATKNLTPLDPEQNRVIEEAAVIRQLIVEESENRAARWTAFSDRLVTMTQVCVAAILDGVN